MSEIPVCGFDVDKVKSRIPGDFRGMDKVPHNIFNFGIADHVFRSAGEFPVQQRMRISRSCFQPVRTVRM